MKIPNIPKIAKKAEGRKVENYKFQHNATIPSDKDLLGKLGIKRGDKVLSIATYYGDWAKAIAKAGAIVDYSDVSKSMVSWAKRNLKGFGKYICSDYIYLPKKEQEYDWTFTFEALGVWQGLPLAYLRSLLNKKGGILVSFPRLDEHGKPVGGKEKVYPQLIKILGKIYGAKYKIKHLYFFASRHGDLVSAKHVIYAILTNSKARKLARKDIEALFLGKIQADSRKRLNKIATLLIRPEFVKEI